MLLDFSGNWRVDQTDTLALSMYVERKLKELMVKQPNELAKTLHFDDVAVHYKNSANKNYHGRAYNGIPQISKSFGKAKYLVIMRIHQNLKFPFKTSIGLQVNGMDELIVYLLAHELTHIMQYKFKAKCGESEPRILSRYMVAEYRKDTGS